MKVEEANKIIAQYMDIPYCACNDGVNVEAHDLHPKFYDSLDDLVPTWEKLEYLEFRGEWVDDKYRFKLITNNFYTSEGKTIQEAACIATANAIKELNND